MTRPAREPRYGQTEDARALRVLHFGLSGPELAQFDSSFAQLPVQNEEIHRADEASALLDAERFDLIVLDVDQMDVFCPQFIAALRGSEGRSAGAVIAVIGTLIMPEFRTQLLKAGADHVLQAPMGFAPLAEALELERGA